MSALTRSIAAALAAAALAACDKPSDTAWQGYIEGEFVQLAAPYAGQLQKLCVQLQLARDNAAARAEAKAVLGKAAASIARARR